MRSTDEAVPEEVGLNFIEAESQRLTATSWGVAVSGTLLFNGISGEGADPFYPTTYNGADTTAERVDGCHCHP